MGDIGYHTDRLNRSHLIIGVHDRHKDCLVSDRCREMCWIDQAIPINREDGDDIALTFEEAEWRRDGGVFNCRGDDVIAVCPIAKGDALQREIVRLTPTPGEHDCLRFSTDERCDLFPRTANRRARTLAIGMITGWIAKVLTEVWLHRLEHNGIYWCRSVIVQVDWWHHC